jgi:hypothetical protein
VAPLPRPESVGAEDPFAVRRDERPAPLAGGHRRVERRHDIKGGLQPETVLHLCQVHNPIFAVTDAIIFQGSRRIVFEGFQESGGRRCGRGRGVCIRQDATEDVSKAILVDIIARGSHNGLCLQGSSDIMFPARKTSMTATTLRRTGRVIVRRDVVSMRMVSAPVMIIRIRIRIALWLVVVVGFGRPTAWLVVWLHGKAKPIAKVHGG